MEIWNPVIGFEGLYEVSSDANVRSIRRQNPKNKRWMGGSLVKPIIGSRGYYVVNLTRSGLRKQVFLHKMVLEAFLGPRPEGMQGCHNDGNPLNCIFENLRWDTPSGNHKDKRLHGTWQVGEKANNSKFTSDVIFDIRKNGLTAKQASEKYGMSLTHAKRVINKESWSHLDV